MSTEQPTLIDGATGAGTDSTAFDLSRASARWAETLIDPTAANRLAYYRDLKSGTLDLSGADPLAVDRLLLGAPQTIGQLFPAGRSPDDGSPAGQSPDGRRSDALRRARTIRSRMRDLAEERGIEAGYVAIGMATWAEPDRTPRAPVLLYSLRIDAVTVAEHDFRLTVDPMPTLNPVLIFKLAREHGVIVDGDELIDDDADATIDPAQVFAKLIKAADEVPDFQIAPTRLIGTFTYEKLPMVTDLENAAELLSRSDAVAALAGDRAAGLRLASVASIAVDAPDTTAPGDEFLVLDADASQSFAINSVLAGQHLVIKGPPGTGKSQTIANLIAALAARGRTTLFVAEKRAAIDAVVGRLAAAGLDDLVQNLHSEGTSRRQFAQAMATRLQRISQEILPETSELHRRLTTRRDRLAAHHQAMHARRAPWEVTAFEAQQRLMGLAPFATPTRWRGNLLDQVTAEKAGQLRDALAELARLGEFAPSRWSEPWARATLASSAQVPAAMDAAGRLDHELLPTARAQLQQAIDQTGLRPPANLTATRELISLVEEVQATLTAFRPGVYAGPLDRWLAATAERSQRKALMPQLGWSERRMAVRELSSLWLGRGRPAKGTLHGSLLAVRDQLIRWREASHPTAIPAVPPALDAARESLRALDDGLEQLAAFLPLSAETITLDALQRLVDTLAADQAGLMRACRRNELRAAITPWQTQRLLEELGRRNADAAGAQAAFDHAWLSSILDHVVASDPAYAQFHGDALHAVAGEYADADRGHIGTTAGRVRHAAAAHLVSVLDRHPEQQQLIRKEAAKKARHLPMRELFRRAPEVLTAVKPCWAMSPLLVSQVLPPQRLFDVVVFDEASQVEPTEGITAIMRGSQVVVAGDEHQLPPTRFFDRADAPESAEDDDEGELTADVESLLQAFAAALPMSQVKHLSWHYRSRDERLIAFSNSHIYAPNGNALTTFPGTAVKGSLTHHPGGADEVATVVELILAHARQRPGESLGVITMGLTHAEKIDTALRKVLTKLPELHGFFSATSHEPFFVKNIERVQGDERDAIIISVGYGKSADGRMLYRFGPLNNAGGHRRLNVAITRAKRRVTVVSSFSHLEMDPAKLHGDGTKMLKAYLEFAETGTLGARTDTLAARLTPFETDVRDRLIAAGIPLTVSYGVSGQRIDFAATHPERPEELILAIEADGATYHSGATVRDRERLRKEHLERLGWRFHRIWSTDWARDPHHEVARAVEAYQLALAAAEAAAAPVGTVPVAPGTVPGTASSMPPLGPDGEPLTPTLTDLPRQPASPASVDLTAPTSPGHATRPAPAVTGAVASRPAAPFATAPEPAADAVGGLKQAPGDPHERRDSARARTRRRPEFEPGLPIADYTVGTLVELFAWIESDGRLRTEEDALDEAIDELGFQRRGPRIMAELRSALEMSRQRHRQG